jgi:hypothetical protein
VGVSGIAHGLVRRGQGAVCSTGSPSLISRPWSDAAENHLDIRCRLESSSGWHGRWNFLGVPVGAAMAAISRRSLHLFIAGSVGGVSAVRMAPPPPFCGTECASDSPSNRCGELVEAIKEPLLAFPDGFYSICCRGNKDRPCYNFMGSPLAVMTLEMVLIRCVPNASQCLTWACQLRWQSTRKPSHLTNLARMSNDHVTPRHFSFQSEYILMTW